MDFSRFLLTSLLLVGLAPPAWGRPSFDCYRQHLQIRLRMLEDQVMRKVYSENGFLRKQIAALQKLPKRSLENDPIARQYLREHKVYVSLTTSPARIEKVTNVLKTLDLTHVEEVLVVVPERYRRTGETYVIPQELEAFPKVRILRVKEDLGPAAKLVPTAEYLRGKDPESLVITVDDDTGYPNGMVNELIHVSARNPQAVVASAGQDVSFWGIPASFSKSKGGSSVVPGTNQAGTLKPVDVVEGFGGIAYRAGLVDTRTIREWSSRCKECALSDDLVISMSLQKAGVPRYVVDSPFFNRNQLRQFDYGFGADALHKDPSTHALAPAGRDIDPNRHKYQLTFEALQPDLK